jgi:hypothetical protein
LCQIVFKYSPRFQPWETYIGIISGVPTVETVGNVSIHIVCIFFKYSPRFQPWEALETYRHHLVSQRLKPLAMFQFILFIFLNIAQGFNLGRHWRHIDNHSGVPTVETVGNVPIYICIFFLNIARGFNLGKHINVDN